MHGAGGQFPLACFARVVLSLLDAVPSEHGHELMGGSAVFGGGGGIELSGGGGRAWTQAGLVTPVSELVPEAGGGVGLTVLRYQVRHVATRGGVDDRP